MVTKKFASASHLKLERLYVEIALRVRPFGCHLFIVFSFFAAYLLAGVSLLDPPEKTTLNQLSPIDDRSAMSEKLVTDSADRQLKIIQRIPMNGKFLPA